MTNFKVEVTSTPLFLFVGGEIKNEWMMSTGNKEGVRPSVSNAEDLVKYEQYRVICYKYSKLEYKAKT